MKSICFDFDGVIHQYSLGWHTGEIYDPPIPGILDAIRGLQQRGHPVVISSCRSPSKIRAWMAQVAPDIRTADLCVSIPASKTHDLLFSWHDDPLFWNEIGVVLVTRLKPSCAVYIDDNAMEFSGFDSAEELLAKVRFRLNKK